MKKSAVWMASILLSINIVFGEQDSVLSVGANDSSLMPRKAEDHSPAAIDNKAQGPEVKTVTAHYGLEIPAGVIFGKFEKDNGPFIVKGSLIVPAGEALEFGPGCVILMANYATITVFGRIIAKGTRQEPVVFQSGNKTPNPWDWDRIYCRSRNRSVFEYCIFRHSNYGVYAENGSVSIDRCSFEKNSLHGLVVKNADVTVKNTSFTKGHVVAIYCLSGADVLAESLSVSGNITGAAFCDNARFEMNGGSISNNTNGCAVMRGAAVSIVATDITRNKTGVISQKEIPRKMSEMVYGNTIDMAVAEPQEMELMMRTPEGVKSIVLPTISNEVVVKESFKPGFSAIKAPREETSSFIGNVTTGFKYFSPHSKSVRDTFALQTRYPGEDASGFADKVQPELQVFANGKKGNADVDVLVDVYGNQYMGFRRNMTTLSLNYSNQSVVLGDFYENFSETSINGRKLTGIKFEGNYVEMGKGTKRVTVQTAFGQSEMAKEVGGHELDLYNDTVDTGMSIRQQLTYVASVMYKPNFISSIGVKGIIARDQAYNTFIGGKVIHDPKAPGLVESQTGSIDGKIDLLGGKLSLIGELDMGVHDTLTDTGEIASIAWYDPQVPEALKNVFGVISTNKNYSASIGATGLLKGYTINANFTQIAPNYFSAGNPYLELDRRTLNLTAEKEFSDKLSGNASFEYQRRAVHEASPTDNNSAIIGSKYAFGENLPELSLGYTFNFEKSPRSQNERVDSIVAEGDTVSYDIRKTYMFKDIKHLISVEGKQRLRSGIDFSLRYQILYEDDFSAYADTMDKNKRDGLQHQVNAWLSFKAGKFLRNKVTGKFSTQRRVQDSLSGVAYKVGDEVRLTVLPRKLTCNVKGEFGKRVDNKFNSTINRKRDEITKMTGIEGEVKYSFTSRASLSIMGRYETNEDTETISDNYSVDIFGMHFTYLF
jgi:hypothetical protein